LQRSQFGLDQMRMQTAMTAAVKEAIARLANDENLFMDHHNEDWAKVIDVTDPGGITIRVNIRDASAHFDLNNLYMEIADLTTRPVEDIAGDLFNQCGDFSSGDRIGSLIDWIDPDNEGFREKEFYSERLPPYEPTNRYLTSFDELFQVNGFSPEWLNPPPVKNNQPFLAEPGNTFSIIPVPRRRPIPVNINSAPRQVLVGILGMENSTFVDQLLGIREHHPIRSLNLITQLIDNERTRSTINTYLDVKSQYFTIEARSHIKGNSAALNALVHRNPDGKTEVIRWVL
jgi:type II secretory pathway component PulK